MKEEAFQAPELSTAAAAPVRGKRWPVHAIGIAIAACYVAILLATARDIGFARDEGFYFSASESYARWFEILVRSPGKALKKESVGRHWSINSEHPSLMKSLFGLSWLLFHKKLGVMGPSTSFRFPGMLMAGLLLYLVAVFGTSIGGYRTGIVASLALALMPRFFYHSHLDCFDVAISAMWFATVFAFWKSLASFRWAVVAGLVWGLALETKLNAFFIPATLLVFYLVRYAGEFYLAGASRGRKGSGRAGLPPLPLAFPAMVLLGLPLFWLLWPWIWYDTIPRLDSYLGFHLHHPYYNIAYFGKTWFKPPFPISYPFVMTIITVPFTTTALSFIGMGARLRLAVVRWIGRSWKQEEELRRKEEEQKGISLLLLLNMMVPIIVIALPSTPIFGGTKHWMPAWPFIALFAGFGFRSVANGIGKLASEIGWRRWSKGRETLAALASGLLFLAAAGQQTEASHPFGLSHYTLPVGETPGSADAGMCRQFWGFTTGSALGWLNENVPKNGRVYFHDTAWDSWSMYHKEGTLREDIRWSGGIEGSDVAMVHWEQHMSGYEYAIWTWMGTVTPAHVVSHQGVAILPIYKMPEE